MIARAVVKTVYFILWAAPGAGGPTPNALARTPERYQLSKRLTRIMRAFSLPWPYEDSWSAAGIVQQLWLLRHRLSFSPTGI